MTDVMYDGTDPESIERFAIRLVGHTLKEMTNEEGSTDQPTVATSKGSFGTALERLYFKIKPGNDDGVPDFKEAGVELKSCPTINRKGRLRSKERLVLNIINYEKMAREDWSSSTFWKKNKDLLLVFYVHQNRASIIDLKVILAGRWKFPEEDLTIIRHDWNVIQTKILQGKAHGIEGKKGVLWWHIERILKDNIERGTPIPFVLLENVDRLVRSPAKQRGRDFGIILSCLNNLGYVVEWRVINASEYGYPQKRRRTFIFATLAKAPVEDLYTNKADVKVLTEGGFFAPEFPCRLNGDTSGSSICLWSDLVKMTERFEFDFQNAGYMKDGRIFTVRVVPTFTWDKSTGKGTLGSVLEKEVDKKYLIPEEWIGDERDRGVQRHSEGRGATVKGRRTNHVNTRTAMSTSITRVPYLFPINSMSLQGPSLQVMAIDDPIG